MKIPACACPSLSMGGTYNALASMAGGRIFPTDIPTTTTKLNTITSDFQLVQKSRDVSKLLDFSAEVSLKIGTNLINADWAGQFIKETKNEEEMISVMAVMKCTKVLLYMLVYQLRNKFATLNNFKNTKFLWLQVEMLVQVTILRSRSYVYIECGRKQVKEWFVKKMWK